MVQNADAFVAKCPTRVNPCNPPCLGAFVQQGRIQGGLPQGQPARERILDHPPTCVRRDFTRSLMRAQAHMLEVYLEQVVGAILVLGGVCLRLICCSLEHPRPYFERLHL